MNKTYIDIILDIDNLRSIQKTAGLHHYTYQNVYRVLRNVEKEMGFSLFEKQDGELLPTEHGSIIIDKLRALQKINCEIEEIKRSYNKIFEVGYSPSFDGTDLLYNIPGLSDNDNIKIMGKLITDQVQGYLDNHNIDLYISSSLDDCVLPERTYHKMIRDFAIYVVYNQKHFSFTEEVSLKELSNTKIICSNKIKKHLMKIFSQKDQEFLKEERLLNFAKLLEEGKGVIIVPESHITEPVKKDMAVSKVKDYAVQFYLSYYEYSELTEAIYNHLNKNYIFESL